LEKSNYEVKALRLTDVPGNDAKEIQETVAKEVPDDATAVVIAGPHVALERSTLDALGRYMNPKEPDKKKGKLVVLLDVVVNPDKTMLRTGLETMLSEYGVEVGNDRVMSPVLNSPTRIIALADPQPTSRNSLAAALSEFQVGMTDVRTIRPRSTEMPADRGNFQTDTLLLAFEPRRVWAETNLSDPNELLDEYRRGVRQPPQPARALVIGVTVSEPTGGMKPGDPHAMLRGGDSKPRLVVVGNAGFASDQNEPRAPQGVNPESYSLVSGSLAWLREKPTNIGIEGKSRDKFKLPETSNVDRLIFVPMLLMLASIVGLGLGVWVVRRR
jgi:hypothetical protein